MATDASRDSGPSRASAALALIVSFVLGTIAGAALLHIVRLSLGPPPGGGPPGPPPIARLERELGLSRDQRDRLRSILDLSRERMHAEADATRDRIREILTPEQRARFDTMRPPPPPPGFPPPPGGHPPPPPGVLPGPPPGP